MDITPSESAILEDFGQKVDLTRRIREVLLNYPEGTTVLKELIQNADDAGATKICLCLDRRSHGTESLLSDRLAQWQGPALLAYNNAVFTEEDFLSISRIGGSAKHGQAWKTGRFGVGFNSVYHLTDLPSFVSGKYVVLFDPQGAYLPNVSTANPGKRIDFVTSSVISLYKDQLNPYCVFGCDMKNPFPGTLFRFPLRNADQAAVSKLSTQSYLEDDISSMFVQLYEEGVFSLLFLKSLLCIEMYEWDTDMPEPRKTYSCSVNSDEGDMVWHRQTVLRLSKATDFREAPDRFKLNFVSEAFTGKLSQQRIDTFYIVQKMASPTSRIGSFAATASKDFDIHLLPWASVAACVSDNSSNDDIPLQGRAFCFLPLPVKTGLRVQINGFFEVSSNRRGIWYGADMDRSGRIRSLWNRLLLEDVVAPCFGQLLLSIQEILGPTKAYYSLWPNGSFNEPWSILVEHIYKSISDLPVFFSAVEGGKWVSGREAFLYNEDFSSKELEKALVELGMPVVHLPNGLFNMLVTHGCGIQWLVVTPDSVRQYLKGCKCINFIDRSYRLMLLEYCIEDLVDADVGKHVSGLPLLPLANGDFGSFSEPNDGVSYFICNELEHMLLQNVADNIIDYKIPGHILNRLLAVANASGANIFVFNVDEFLKLLQELFPAEWRYKPKVLWEPDSHTAKHPTSSWFVLFWRYIRVECEKLSSFGDWPILPSLSCYLFKPSKHLKLLNPDKLSEQMRQILFDIGCNMLNAEYGVEHPDLFHYVYEADCAGVLKSIFDVASSSDDSRLTFLQHLEVGERDELRRFLLDPKWYIGNCMDDSDIWNCKRLPIYRVHGGESSESIQFSDLVNPQKYLRPLDCPESLLSGEFIISLSSTEEEVLNRYFGIKRMGKPEFYKRCVLTRISGLDPTVRDNIMVSVLKELPQLCSEDASFREMLKSLNFIPTFSGSLKSPAVLYDPRNEELFSLLEDSDCFPSGAFNDDDVLDMLKGLGLRSTVSTETIIESAQQVELLMQKNQEMAQSRGKVLLSYLEVNAMKLLPDHPKDDHQRTMNRMFARAANVLKPRHIRSDLEKFWNDLRLISWCPVLIHSTYQSLPWPAVSSMVAPPKIVRPYADLWLVSASMRILDGECSSSVLSNQLGWSSPPGGSVIAAQLLELGKNNEIVSDPELRQELTLAMPRIYSILTAMIGSDEMDIVKAILEGCRWIWVGDGFATPDEVVLNGPLHLAPYMRVIPIDLAVFKDLFFELGVQESLRPSDYANILCRMASRKGSLPLDTEEIRAAILIAQHLSDVQFYEDQIKIYLPDVSCRLFNATDLVYNDAPWLLDSDDPDSSNGSAMALHAKQTIQRFVHGNISNDVAEKLGVRSFRRILLAESADSMNLSLSGAAEAFGQHESLTTRLRHILEMYADGPGVLFELVQNAEDANASKVAFLLDKSQYGTSSVLSPEMADWQGPALYCFNNSVFSPQDLYAISRIGQESKLEKPFAIGRFGLGFNSVYHFTDIPTFVSGENVVMFDPHACNLPGISPSHPGLRIKFVGRRILEQFPDQFSPFLHFGCDLQHPFRGTLFRFPLRSATVALRSQIKKEVYEPDDVLTLFSSFSEVVSETLLFLRNVKNISIFVKEGANSEMQLIHSVQKQYVSEPEGESDSFDQVFGLMSRNQPGMDKVQFLNQLCKSIDTKFQWKCQKILLSEKGSSGGRSYLWLASECLGNIRSRSHQERFGEMNKFVPWACVATCLQSVNIVKEMLGSDNSFEETVVITPDMLDGSLASAEALKTFEGRAFCFLPLPICTGLPVHVNAYFELSSNRRDIWFGNDMAGGGKKRSDWNTYLLEDVAAPAYGHLIEKVASEIGPCDLFFTFWPMVVGFEPWTSMVRKFYNYITDANLRVLHTRARGGHWISTKQAIFPDFSFSKALELVEALSDAGLPIASIPKAIVDNFMEICPSLNFLTPQLLRTLLIRKQREFRDRNAMILTLEYCLLDLQSPFQSESFYGLPLLPLSNGLFTKFEKRGASERIYIAHGDGYDLLKDSLPNQLIDSSISDFLHGKLCEIAQSENFNVTFLTCPLLEKLLVRLLPVEWQQAKQVIWVPSSGGHPSVEWMKLLWNYLKCHCDDLSLFCNWPILPIENSYLLRLVENSNVIMDGGWSENMSSLLLRVGCFVLMLNLPIEHPQLELYVQPPTAAGILNALLAIAGKPDNVEGLFSDALEGELHELRSYILQSKWFSEGSINSTHMNTIKHIPMFESFKSRKLVSLSRSTKWLAPNDVCEDFLNDDFLRMESEKDRIILNKYFEISEPTKVVFYKDYVLNRMVEFVLKEGFLSAILQDINFLMEKDDSFKAEISKVAFVSTCNGSLKEPFRLYDPRVSELKMLLYVGAYFPDEKFSDPEILEILAKLGLRKTLGFTGLLDCARSVSMLHDLNASEALVYARRLLNLLDIVALKLSSNEVGQSFGKPKDAMECQIESLAILDEEEHTNGFERECSSFGSLFSHWIDDMPQEQFWSELRSISWCPIYDEPPIGGLPWFAVGQSIAMPTSVRPKSQMWMVSSMMHILDGDCSDLLQHNLGWMDRLNVQILSAQLIGLSNSYAEIHANSHTIHNLDAELQKHVYSVYSQMQEYIGTEDFKFLKSALGGICWVWIGDDFVSTDVLAFDSPLKFSPYLYVVPSELTQFRDLLLELGVRHSFNIFDYLHVLQRLQNDVKGCALSNDQLNFVHCILEAIADFSLDTPIFEGSTSPLIIPDSSGVLVKIGELVYNDAPWMENDTLVGQRFVHPCISHDLANRLGIQSLRSVSIGSEEMMKDFPCMDYSKICDLVELYGNSGFLLFDLLELADCCKSKRLHLILDKREHPRQSLLQHNLGDFQGPALIAILEGASLSRDEVAGLQYLPPWSLLGNTVNYGLGLLSCFSITDFLLVVSDGCLYMFDPRGLALPLPANRASTAKVFSLQGTNLVERFHDQFSPLLIGENMQWSISNSTIIRMPLSSAVMKEGIESGLERVTLVFDKFIKHSSASILFLKSVLQVTLSTWEKESPQRSLDYSIDVDPLFGIGRNPFSERKWKKFQLASLFGSSSASTKLQVIDVTVQKGLNRVANRWLVALSLGSGQTRNMALDRRYMAYNLTPVAGVAALISQNGNPTDTSSVSAIMSPLPLSGGVNLPITILGYFLVCHNRGRFLFKSQYEETSAGTRFDAGNQLIEAWNRELMSCVRDAYIKLVLEMQKLRREPSTSILESNLVHGVSLALNAYGDQIYSFWPRSGGNKPINQELDVNDSMTVKVAKADWECILEQVTRPFYAHLIDQPVWQLYSGNLVKVEEGMFLSQPGSAVEGCLLPATVCAFVKEHYPVFSVPWELVNEIQALGVIVREIKPKMVRDLLRASSTSIVLRSVDTYVDVLEYCLADIMLFEPCKSNASVRMSGVNNSASPIIREELDNSVSLSSPQGQRIHSTTPSSSSSGGDALEMMTSLGKAIFDFGRVVVEDIGRTGVPVSQRSNLAATNRDSFNSRNEDNQRLLSVAAEIRGLPCPTGSNHLTRLGVNEIWIGNKEQQSLMLSLAAKFIHPKVLERSILVNILSNSSLLSLLKIQSFSPSLLANHMRFLFHENWVSHVTESKMAPWFSWENAAISGSEWGPSPEWIRLFWKTFNCSDSLPLFSDWPLVPAFLGRPVLCCVRERHLVFIPPSEIYTISNFEEMGTAERNTSGLSSESDVIQSYKLSFTIVEEKYPWLLSLLNQCNIPIFDVAFMDCAASCQCLPRDGQSLGQILATKFAAAKSASYFSDPKSFSDSERDELFRLFASDFFSNGSGYGREELEVLRDLPIYKTVTGSYTRLQGNDLCMVPSSTFLKPYDEHCLSHSSDSFESCLLRALGIPELHDQQILVKFGLPDFNRKPQSEQEDILIYLYTNWQDLQEDSSIVEALKETHFVKSADEMSLELCKPKDLFDPGDALLASVFSGVGRKFPGERFISDGWLRILRKVGLRNSADADSVLECAKRIESLGSQCVKHAPDEFEIELFNSQDEVSFEVWLLAESLVKSIISNFAVLYSSQFCNLLGKIVCVPAEKGLPGIGGKRCGKRVLCSYSESILLKDWPLAWSCTPILSRNCVVPPEYSWGALNLRSPPPFSTVLLHLQIIGRNSGEDTLSHWPTASGLKTIDEASIDVLKYLDKNWGSLSSSDREALCQVAFIPAANGTRLVTASSLFARLTVNLSPFAFELPALYLTFVNILRDLGLQDTLSVNSAKNLLLSLQKACGYQRLNPNEFRAVLEIVHFICDERNSAAATTWDSDAIVPDDGCRLVHAKSCVYIDSYGSRYVKYIDTTRLRFAHQDLPERICIAFGIKRLSDVVIEELDGMEHFETLEYINSVPVAVVKQKLLCKSFQAAVWSVVCSISSNIQGFVCPVLEDIKRSLESIADKVHFVECLYTRFVLQPKSLDITRVREESIFPEWKGTRHRALYFVDQFKTCVLIAEPPRYVSFPDVVAIVVSRVLDSPFPLPIGSLFLCPEGSETAMVDALKLCSQMSVTGVGGDKDDFLGKELLPQDAVQVQFHPLRPFYAGEIIAWRSGNGEKLKYGRVPEDVRPKAGQAIYRFKVETMSGVIQPILSSNVFSFRCVSVASETSALVEYQPAILNADAESSGIVKSSFSQGQGKRQQTQELQYGRVSAEELVQAVHEMLSTAGINMDVEKQSLLQSTITLQEQLKESQAALLLEQEKSDTASKEAETAKAAWVCRICLNNEVDVSIVPCGHVLCRRCSSAVSRCPFCRLQVAKVMRIFRP
ncbi:sacsin isoform X2 [Ipomoea triloba]|uniref:sacsin isoform X2 n=1 Tax=Ipomoea triloba TaxID=35885 RepID=UPI00125D19E2|nr:sacsin isoform X2 [Ipomoea triloba]